jgi:hypothetical protein
MANFRYRDGAVSPFKRGMTRGQVREILGEFNEFRKTKFSKNSTDEFLSSLAHVFYNENDVVKGVEIFRNSAFIIFGKNLFEMSAHEAKKFIESNSADASSNDVGFNVGSLGIRIYAPEMMDEENAKIESIYIEI